MLSSTWPGDPSDTRVSDGWPSEREMRLMQQRQYIASPRGKRDALLLEISKAMDVLEAMKGEP